MEKLKIVERDNLRLLGKFLDIQKGRHLSVPKANYIENFYEIVSSPVHEFHSVRVLNKINESKQVLKQNLKLAEKLKQTESFLTFDMLQKDWQE